MGRRGSGCRASARRTHMGGTLMRLQRRCAGSPEHWAAGLGDVAAQPLHRGLLLQGATRRDCAPLLQLRKLQTELNLGSGASSDQS